MLPTLYLLWFLRLFKPEWVITFYVPQLGFIKSAPTIILYAMLVYLVAFRARDIKVDIPFAAFLGCVLLSTVFAENTGLGRRGLQGVFDNFAFFVVNLTILCQRDNIAALHKILHIYVLSFLVYALVGIAHKGIVPYHVYLDDEDFFGPFMDIGVAVSFIAAYQQSKSNRFYLLTGIINVVGVIASFARGAFLSFCITGAYMWSRSSNKVTNAITFLLVAFLAFSATMILFPDNKYWKEMATISDSLQDEKSEGRHFLIKKGFEIFYLYPFVGAGPLNYGFVLPRVTSEAEAQGRGMHAAQFATRVAHNIYIQILAELGVFGSATFSIMILMFWIRSLRIRSVYRGLTSRAINSTLKAMQEQAYKMYMLGFAFEAAMIAYLLNGIFYPILFCPWFYDLLILNALIYRHTLGLVKETPKIAPWRPAPSWLSQVGAR
jgi:hypothetical protein